MLIPWKYSGGFLIGKEYEPLKDLLKMNDYDLKTMIPIFLQMTNIWVNNKNKEQQKAK